MMRLTEAEQALLDTCCSLCLGETVLITGEYRWCALHKFRGELLAWGIEHNYPMLDGGLYMIATGAYHWVITTTQGDEDMVNILSGMTEISEVA
jgi:hypothetical protein